MPSKENKKQLKQLQKKLYYKFRKNHFLQEALTHTSFVNENPGLNLQSNERLEFLGDAVLGMVITEYLYKLFPDFSEGKLSILKSGLVSEQTLSELSAEVELGSYLILGRGEDKGATRRRSSVLSNVMEAVIGGVYLDGGLRAAGKFVCRIYQNKFEEIPKTKILGSYKNRLQHYTQTEWGCMPVYKVVSEIGPGHNRVYEITVNFGGRDYGSGRGTSKKRAEQEAAREALIELGLE